ncbi:MAG: hypothetical protein EB064_09995, partial [Betaproteobacteria bacterium]|nr:hypothetical protein [Betaproteobacteria bacterium]
ALTRHRAQGVNTGAWWHQHRGHRHRTSGRAFRIGHLGDQNPASMMGCLAGIEAALLVQGIPIGRDGLARASLALSQTPAVAGTELA